MNLKRCLQKQKCAWRTLEGRTNFVSSFYTPPSPNSGIDNLIKISHTPHPIALFHSAMFSVDLIPVEHDNPDSEFYGGCCRERNLPFQKKSVTVHFRERRWLLTHFCTSRMPFTVSSASGALPASAVYNTVVSIWSFGPNFQGAGGVQGELHWEQGCYILIATKAW